MTALTAQGAGELVRLQQTGAVSALEITRAFLERIDRLDPQLGAFLAVNPRAEDEARAVDRHERPGPLRGVPVAVKDNILVQGMPATCGSRLLEPFVPDGDATAVARLRRAGAVVLGKTNLDEFGMGSSTENSAFATTRNPWDAERVPGGSSGGSIVAVAARMAPVALGSETGGSVRQPASFCGVVGLKPTYGRVSRSGLVAYGSSLDQIAPVARSCDDAARVLEALAGSDSADATSSPEPVGDYRAQSMGGVDGLRVGLPREFLDDGLAREIRDAVDSAAAALEAGGASIEEVRLPHSRFSIPTYYLIATAEASSNLARFDGVRYGRRGGADETLESMYRSTRGRGFGMEVKRRIMLGTYALSAGYYDAYYGKAQRARRLIARDYTDCFERGIDLLLAPVTPTTAFRLGEKTRDPLSMYLSDVYTVTTNLAGLPALAVPVALSGEGLPVGVQLIGPAFDEGRLLAAGRVVERLFDHAPPLCGADAVDPA